MSSRAGSSRTRSALYRLGDRVGILPEYVDQTGTAVRVTSDETRIAILAAMGIDASTPERAREALERLRAAERARILEPVRVVRVGTRASTQVVLRVLPGWRDSAEWSLELATESGDLRRLGGVASPGPNGLVRLALETPPPEGYHALRATIRAGGEERSAEQSLIVIPGRCPSVVELAGQDRVFGVTANLYTLRSAANWGIGDLSDLGALLEWTAEVGGAFAGINPLHALRNRGMDVSPYSPVSRIFRNPIYLDVTAVPELEQSPEASELLGSPEVRDERSALQASDRVEYERVMGLKRRVLELLHRTFVAAHAEQGSDRGRAYGRYLETEGEPLLQFATFEALVDHLGTGDWRGWPDAFRDPRSPEVTAFRSAHPREVGFHQWLQFELDRQLAEAAARGRQAGLAIGLYQDLAIGTSPIGADVWASPQLFLRGVSVGAPPDQYSASGQNWGLPPLDPRALRADAYRYWIRLLRASMRHAGALRIDHVLGLFRQFWIPEGMDGARGAYVRFPVADLLGILALEAHRHRAVVVGEDLGTVPPEVPPSLQRWGVLSSRVFLFERNGERFRAAAEYVPTALATVNTHDMAPLAGFWAGRDIEIKRAAGVIQSDEAAEEQRRVRSAERQALLERLAADGMLPEAREPASGAELRGALHAFLCGTPAEMVGLSLDDLVGESEPVNLPGVPPDRFPSWTRKLARGIETLRGDVEVRVALRCPGRARRDGGRPADGGGPGDS